MRRDILQTLAKWYTDAIDHTSDIEVGGASAATLAAIAAAKQGVQTALATELRASVGVPTPER